MRAHTISNIDTIIYKTRNKQKNNEFQCANLIYAWPDRRRRFCGLNANCILDFGSLIFTLRNKRITLTISDMREVNLFTFSDMRECVECFQVVTSYSVFRPTALPTKTSKRSLHLSVNMKAH